MKNLLINRALAAKKKKIFTLLLAVAASVGTMFAESGICGPSTTWRLSNDTLYLDGNGEVYGGYRGYLWEDFDNSKLIQTCWRN